MRRDEQLVVVDPDPSHAEKDKKDESSSWKTTRRSACVTLGEAETKDMNTLAMRPACINRRWKKKPYS